MKKREKKKEMWIIISIYITLIDRDFVHLNLDKLIFD